MIGTSILKVNCLAEGIPSNWCEREITTPVSISNVPIQTSFDLECLPASEFMPTSCQSINRLVIFP